MTLEDIAFNSIIEFIQTNSNLSLISAHPPSGKSYFTDLIRIPSPTQNKTGSRRVHIDIIFCSNHLLYFCEVKGKSKEADDDIEKLKNIKYHYPISKLRKYISERLTVPNSLLNICSELVLVIGCTRIDSALDNDFLYIEADNTSKLRLKGNTNKIIISDFTL